MAQAQLDDTETCDRKLIGTGPFEFVSWTPNVALKGKRNPNYWQDAPDGKPYPYADAIEIRPDARARRAPQLAARRRPERDAHRRARGHGRPHHGSATTGKVNLLVSAEQAEVQYLLLNAGRAPFDDERVRKAVALALDRDADDRDPQRRPPAEGERSVPERDDGLPRRPGLPRPRPAGGEAARRRLPGRHGQAPSFTLIINPGSAGSRYGDLVQEQLSQAGFSVRVVPEDEAKQINDAIAGQFQAIQWRNHPGEDPDTQYTWWHTGAR